MTMRSFASRRRFASALLLLSGILAPVLVLNLGSGEPGRIGGLGRDPSQVQPGVPPGPNVLPDGSIIANGTRVTISEAVARAPFELHRPQHALASDASLRAVWLSLDPPQVGLQYDSGLSVFVQPSELGDPRSFYEGQIATGTNGSIERIDGVLAFVVPRSAEGAPANLDMVIQDIEVTIIGGGVFSFAGDFTVAELRSVAETVSR